MIQPVSTPRTPTVATVGRAASSPSPFTLSLAAVSGGDAPAEPPIAGATLPGTDGNARQDAAADGSDLPNGDASTDPRLAWIAPPITATAVIDMVVTAAPAVATDTPKPATGSVPAAAAAVATAAPSLADDPAPPGLAVLPATIAPEPTPVTTPVLLPVQAVPAKAKPLPARAPLANPAKRARSDAASPSVAQAASKTRAIASAEPDPDTDSETDSSAATLMVADPAAMIAAFVPPAAPPRPAAPAPASGSAPGATPMTAAAPTTAGAAMVVPLQTAPALVTIPTSPDPTSSIVAPVPLPAPATPSAAPSIATQPTPATAMAALLPPLQGAAPDVTAVPAPGPSAATPLPATGSDLASTMAITAPAPAPVPASSVSGIQPLAIATGPLPIALPDPSRPATATPALQAFAGAMRAGWKQDARLGPRDDTDPLAPTAASPLAPIETVRHAVAATGTAQEQTLDTRRDHWPAQMIDHIESLRDAADATSSKIRVVPDALGTIDLSVKRDGDTIHVHFDAEQAATRTMLADAQPRLAEIAQSRGLRLGDTNMGSGGSGQPQAQQQRMPAQPLPALTNPAPARATIAVGANDDIRIA